MNTLTRICFAVLALGLAACGPHLDVPVDASADVSASDVEFPPPVLDQQPALAPYWIVSVRGSSIDTNNVLIRVTGPAGIVGGPQRVIPGLDGRFCKEILLPGPGAYTIYATAQNPTSGMESASSNVVMTTFSPSAPPVAGAATCEQTDPASCDHTGHCCTGSCSGRTCGDNGCGVSCGTCTGSQSCTPAGVCCTTVCAGRQCGDNGCGGSCGACATGHTCNPTTHQCCAPSCGSHNCGGDGCGGSCGTCMTGLACTSGTCSVPTTCGGFSSCAPCIASTSPGPLCGWCTTTSRCETGSSTGSTDNSCTMSSGHWFWVPGSCP